MINPKELTQQELKLCINEYMRRYRIKNKDKIKSYNKRYNQSRNKKEIKEISQSNDLNIFE